MSENTVPMKYDAHYFYLQWQDLVRHITVSFSHFHSWSEKGSVCIFSLKDNFRSLRGAEVVIPAHSMCVAHCESLVLEAVQSSPLVFSLVSALNRAGCPFSLARHVACEPLPMGMLGGFDKDLNQVLILVDCKWIDTINLGCYMFGQVSGPG